MVESTIAPARIATHPIACGVGASVSTQPFPAGGRHPGLPLRLCCDACSGEKWKSRRRQCGKLEDHWQSDSRTGVFYPHRQIEANTQKWESPQGERQLPPFLWWPTSTHEARSYTFTRSIVPSSSTLQSNLPIKSVCGLWILDYS